MKSSSQLLQHMLLSSCMLVVSRAGSNDWCQFMCCSSSSSAVAVVLNNTTTTTAHESLLPALLTTSMQLLNNMSHRHSCISCMQKPQWGGFLALPFASLTTQGSCQFMQVLHQQEQWVTLQIAKPERAGWRDALSPTMYLDYGEPEKRGARCSFHRALSFSAVDTVWWHDGQWPIQALHCMPSACNAMLTTTIEQVLTPPHVNLVNVVTSLSFACCSAAGKRQRWCLNLRILES